MPLTDAQTNFLDRANLPVALTDDADAQREIAAAALNWYNVQRGGIDVKGQAQASLLVACEKADG